MLMLPGRATRWISDDFPGFVEIEFDDVDGVTHRFEEKAAVVDSGSALRAGSSFPVDVDIACRPHARELRGGTVVDVVDLAPWGIGDAGATYSVARELLSWRSPALYSDLSVRARQAVALVTFARWREAVGLRVAELVTLEDHLWQWMTVDGPEAFRGWYESHQLTGLGPGRPFPDPVRDQVAALGLDEREVQDAVRALVDITYGGLFGGIESRWSLAELQTVGDFTARHGVPLAPAASFLDSLWIDGDWGRPDGDAVARWRAER
ncbi:hypothetical protein [Cellulomonas sp. KH9]|uniref:hypothetical protein n=1 Tax=Cellulomonas sp. KH9 TaxID=1855324 RepID=UPI0011602DE1|nr:hypothetical protein [Cellulomonas sp. KH9]